MQDTEHSSSFSGDHLRFASSRVIGLACLALLTMGIGPCQDDPPPEEPVKEEPVKEEPAAEVAPVRILHAIVDVGDIALRVDGERISPDVLAPLTGSSPSVTLVAGERVLEILRVARRAEADAGSGVAAPGAAGDSGEGKPVDSPLEPEELVKDGGVEKEGASNAPVVEVEDVLLKTTIKVRPGLPQFLLLGGALKPLEGEQALTARVLRDDQAAEVGSKEVLARVIHAAVNLPPLDVTLSAAGEPAALSFVNVAFGRGAAYRAVEPGIWRLRMTSGLDKDSPPVYDDKKAALTGKGRHALVVTGRHGDRERPLRVWIVQPEVKKDGGG